MTYDIHGRDIQRLDVERLHELICAGNRKEAIDHLREVYPTYGLLSFEQYRNLFPDRVPA
jgi:hypothetical protein